MANGSARDSTKVPLSGGNMTGWLSWNSTGRILGSFNALYLAANGSINAVNYNNSAYVPINASQFINASSKLVKRNIEPLSSEEATKILRLDVVTFDYIEGYGNKSQRGLIAEDVINLIPSVVHVPDEYDENKVSENISKGKLAQTLGIDYSKLVPYLIKMIQIQQKDIDALKKSLQ